MTELIEHLRRRGSLKWNFYDENVLAAWVAEMDFGLAPAVSEALHDAVDRGITGYPFPGLESAVAEAAAGYWATRFDWKADPSWIFPAPDVIEGIRRCIMHLTRAGSPVVLHTPVYFPFFSMVERAGREIIEVPSPRDDTGRYSLDLAGMERGLETGAGSIVVCNPWNPTGRVFTSEELEEVIRLAERYGARVISDEVHAPIVYPGAKHTPIGAIGNELTITVTAASKAWNLPGLKCAQVILANDEDRDFWEGYFTPEKVGVGTFGLVATEAAYARGGGWFDEVLSRLRSNRDLFTTLVSEHVPSAVLVPAEGTYLAWLDLSDYGLDDPSRFILEEARVAFASGAPFRGEASQIVRVNFATEPEILVEMMERVGKTLSSA